MQNKTGLILGLVGVGIGSGVMFFLDPNRGRQRRAAVRDQAKRTSRQLERAAKSLDHTAQEIARNTNELTHRMFVWKKKAMRLVA